MPDEAPVITYDIRNQHKVSCARAMMPIRWQVPYAVMLTDRLSEPSGYCELPL